MLEPDEGSKNQASYDSCEISYDYFYSCFDTMLTNENYIDVIPNIIDMVKLEALLLTPDRFNHLLTLLCNDKQDEVQQLACKLILTYINMLKRSIVKFINMLPDDVFQKIIGCLPNHFCFKILYKMCKMTKNFCKELDNMNIIDIIKNHLNPENEYFKDCIYLVMIMWNYRKFRKENNYLIKLILDFSINAVGKLQKYCLKALCEMSNKNKYREIIALSEEFFNIFQSIINNDENHVYMMQLINDLMVIDYENDDPKITRLFTGNFISDYCFNLFSTIQDNVLDYNLCVFFFHLAYIDEGRLLLVEHDIIYNFNTRIDSPYCIIETMIKTLCEMAMSQNFTIINYLLENDFFGIVSNLLPALDKYSAIYALRSLSNILQISEINHKKEIILLAFDEKDLISIVQDLIDNLKSSHVTYHANFLLNQIQMIE